MRSSISTYAAVALAAALAGAVSGAWLNGSKWESRYHARENELLRANREALERAKSDAKIISDAADAIRRAPVQRVLCAPATTTAAAGVPADRADASVGAAGPVRADRDYGPALREAIALAARVKAYNDATQ